MQRKSEIAGSSRYKTVSLLFVVFYSVGVAGMVWPLSAPLFLKLIPFALLLSFTALVFFHSGHTDRKTVLAFLSVYIISFLVEAIGVNTGQVFGSYRYGQALGPKLLETPLIIGINWLFLVYTTAAVLENRKLHPLWKILLASLAMLLYDMVLEQVAPQLDMWHWKSGTIPVNNYLAWFGLAVVFHALLKFLKIKIQNKLAQVLLLTQFLFFFLLYLLFKLTQ